MDSGLNDGVRSVAKSRAELEAISGELTLEKIQERKNKETYNFQPLTDEERAASWGLIKK